ncbi:LacI family DNA-binding transcriptional regulator [Staphylococcus sp. KG4-3]|uniref:LacI family DNA-binding transcriptional regulator n=1 Tax=Staphylococcus TaxID=1279 RepID=UPI0015FA7A85|nr:MULTISPECIES: LacI family DNA-binding transcriptional regulator [Staphylococcus]MDW8542098.1 LacI family DNA-binding transcriptional regulator [Staphylococcus sp. KG4-1]MDW8560594.1 LacI family DNA-binding transcriptional regulator [Staphylococcus sp. KG4-3]
MILLTTIKDVALLAGCSVATVSRAINNTGYVKAETRSQIDRAIVELNYQPNEAARTLYKRKSKMIGLLLPDISNPFFTLIARGVEDVAVEHGYQVLIGNSDNDIEKAKAYLTTFVSHNCAGMITTALNEKIIENMLGPLHMPFVFVDRTNNEISGVSTDHYEGGQRQAELVIEGVCNYGLVVHEDLTIDAFKSRVKGVVSIFKERGINYKTYLAQDLNDEGSFINLIRMHNIDSIICSNDLLAIKVMGILQQHNLQIPKDVQIVGYDNIPFSTMTFPKISTIDQSAYRLGELAMSKLLKLYDNQDYVELEKVAISVIKRSSTRH